MGFKYSQGMRTQNISINQVSSSRGWQEIIALANNHANRLQYEEVVECCLEFLHDYLTSPVYKEDKRPIANDLNIIFACGGNASRWENFLGIPKQLVDTGSGLSLVQRTVNQFRVALPGAELYLLTRQEEHEFQSIEDVTFVSRKDNIERRILEEVLGHTSKSLHTDHHILLLYGDVYFSDEAVKKIRKKVLLDSTTIALFGRRHQNALYGNTGGEDFGVYAPLNSWQLILDYHALLKRLYIGTRLYRYGTWEFITLLSALTKAKIPGAHRACLINNDVSQTICAMSEVWKHKDFDQDHWVDIDDETEDFDFPCEYIERMARMVQWVGEGNLTSKGCLSGC
jgi:hypothetical protein